MNGNAKHHLVSLAYQRNWADAEKRVSIISADDGRLIDPRRATRRNFVVAGFNTFRLPSGMSDSSLEEAFSKIETFVLPAIRETSTSNAGPAMKRYVVNLFAMHLVRSQALRDRGEAISEQVLAEQREQIELDEKVRAKFTRETGRDPEPGELVAITETVHANNKSVMARDSMVRLYGQVEKKLSGLHLQVVQSDARLPGFALGDVPVVHADPARNRYGFADHLAIGDANMIGAPLTPHVAAFFTQQPQQHVTVKTKKLQQAINAYFIRGAIAEVVCRHQDAINVGQVARRSEANLQYLARWT